MYSYEEHLMDTAAKQGSQANSAKVGYFKLLPNNMALVRINYSSTSDFTIVKYHQFDASQRFNKIECLNYDRNSSVCPFCSAFSVEGNQPTFSRAKVRIFVPMLVSYVDPNNGNPSSAVPVVWDAPANDKQDYAKLLATKIKDFGDLRQHVFVLRRIGDGLSTSYTLDYVPMYDNPKYVSDDLSAFNGFRIDKHSYFIKSAEEMETFIETGSFPDPQVSSGAKAETADTTIKSEAVSVDTVFPIENNQVSFTFDSVSTGGNITSPELNSKVGYSF